MPAERRQQIAAIATENGISIIEDDVYGFVPGELAPLPVSSHAPERTFYINSTSKSIAPGLRIGYVVAPPDSVSRIANAIHSCTLEAAPIMSELATIWIESGAAAETIKWKQEEIAARHALALNVLGVLGEVSKHPSCHI
jgi:DNA-binding transcriptional MocR family regulator